MTDSRSQPMSDKDHIRVLQEEADSYHRFWIEERSRAVYLRAQLAIARKALEEIAGLTYTDGTPTKQALDARAALKEIS